MIIAPMQGRVRNLHVSDDGVPKRAVDRIVVRVDGIDGDRQRDLVHHGGPDRVVCLLGWEVIDAIAAEGHPIRPGSTGENVTVEGLTWAALGPGWRLEFGGGVTLEVTDFAPPCRTIQASFADQKFGRLAQARNPGSSRIYARVLTEGTIGVGDLVIARP